MTVPKILCSTAFVCALANTSIAMEPDYYATHPEEAAQLPPDDPRRPDYYAIHPEKAAQLPPGDPRRPDSNPG